MKFQELENKFIDYLDDALTAEQRLEVENQLAQSAELRQTLEELKMVMRGLDNAEIFQPSENLQRNFDDFLRSEKNKLGGGDATILDLKNRNSGRNRFFLQIASAAAILLLGIFVGKNIG